MRTITRWLIQPERTPRAIVALVICGAFWLGWVLG